MKTLDREHVRSVVNTIFSQLLHTTSIDVINSWGISKMYATQIVKNVNGEDFTMAALVMQVNGFQFQGKVYIALDEGSDYYRIYGEKDGTTKEYHHDIAFDELGDVLDLMIETGGMTKEEYQAKVKDFVCSHRFSFRNKTDLLRSMMMVKCRHISFPATAIYSSLAIAPALSVLYRALPWDNRTLSAVTLSTANS